MYLSKPNWHRIPLALLLAAALVISGCATTGSSLLGGAQTDPRLTQGNDAKFFSRSGFQACAGAATIGIAACMLAASADKKALCAVAAGVAACGIAMGTNYYLDYRRSQYKSTGEMLDAITHDVEQDTLKLQERSQTLQAVIASDEQKLAQLKQEIDQNKVDQTAAQKRLDNIDADIKHMTREMDNIDDKIASYREAASSTPDSRKLDTQIEKLQLEAGKLRDAMGSLTAQRNSLNWGNKA